MLQSSMDKRVVITGMSVVTGLGHTLEDFLAALMANRSAIRRWTSLDTSNVYGKVGGDLADFNCETRAQQLRPDLPEEIFARMTRLMRRAPWSTRISMLLATDAFRDAGIYGSPGLAALCPVIVAGHNQNSRYISSQFVEFDAEPDYIDPLFSLHALDTDHGGSVSEVLKTGGPLYTVGGACASGNLGLRLAVDEVRFREADCALVVAPVLDIAPMDLHGMALMGAISFQSFNEDPAAASRPYDRRREGFVPSHGGAALIVESLDSALRRGARIYAEVLAVEASADGNHLPQPSSEGQVRAMRQALRRAGMRPDQVDYISAHATSTPLGDTTEIRSIKTVFGPHAYRLKLNAPKSLLGHTCWSAPTVETVAAILQMRAGRLHRSINIDDMDPEVDLDVCRHENTPWPVRVLLKNSFGFGGINCVALLSRYDGH
jgi:3-oxoacyl-(acyl-carrier-protein) synthase